MLSQSPAAERSGRVGFPWKTDWIGSVIPSSSGLYRISRASEQSLDYIGQTGLPLRYRLAMLVG